MIQITNKTNCAGQKCPDREDCRRYKVRFPDAHWASFDIERQHFGTCAVQVPLTQGAQHQVNRD